MYVRIALVGAALLGAFGIGFGAGIYALPILVDFRNAGPEEISAASPDDRRGVFSRNLAGSDPLHWGEGSIRLGMGGLVFEENVRLSPGPDYRVYLTTRFVDTKEAFVRIKPKAIQVGKVKTFSGPLQFEVPATVNRDAYDNVVVWCEAFSMFITGARLD